MISCDGREGGGGGAQCPFLPVSEPKRRVRAANGRVALPVPSNIIQESRGRAGREKEGLSGGGG